MLISKFKFDQISKGCAVALGLSIPLSTTLTNILLLTLIANWFLAGNLKEKIDRIIRHPIARVSVFFYSLFLIGTLYSPIPHADISHFLMKMTKLLYI